jgi:THO complex subunit 3
VVLPAQKHTLLPSPNPPPGRPHAQVRTLAFSPAGNNLLTGSSDRVVRVYDPKRPSLKSATELRGHAAPIERAVWDPTSTTTIASLDSGGELKVFDTRSRSSSSSLNLGGQGLTLAYVGDGTHIVASRKDDTFSIIDVRTNSSISTYTSKLQTHYFSLSPSPSLDSTIMFLPYTNGSVEPISLPSFTPVEGIPLLKAHTATAHTAKLSPRGNFLAIGGSDALISLWDTREWVCLHTLDKMEGAARSIAFSFDGLYVVGGSDESAGLEVACIDGEYVASLKTGSHGITGIDWHPSRYWLAYSGDAHGVRVIGVDGL